MFRKLAILFCCCFFTCLFPADALIFSFFLSFWLYFFFPIYFQWFPACVHLDSGPVNLLIQTSSFIFLPHQYIQKQFPFISSTGVVCVEDVSGAMLGFLSSWRLFQETVWGPAGLKQVRFQPTSLSSELWAVYQLLFQFVFEPLTFSTPINGLSLSCYFAGEVPMPCFFSTTDDATWCI